MYSELEANLGRDRLRVDEDSVDILVFELVRGYLRSWRYTIKFLPTGNSRMTRVEDVLKKGSTTKLQGKQPMTVPDARVLGIPIDRRREEIAKRDPKLPLLLPRRRLLQLPLSLHDVRFELHSSHVPHFDYDMSNSPEIPRNTPTRPIPLHPSFARIRLLLRTALLRFFHGRDGGRLQ